MLLEHRRSWRRAANTGAALVVSLLAGMGRAAAQDAGIVGQVVDESGAALPGVTVTAKSPALQLPQVTTVTDNRGEYRLTPLPIGTYEVTYDIPGFQSVRREGLRLTSGFTAKIDIEMRVGALQESVTVTGASPVVDVTATSTSTRLTSEMCAFFWLTLLALRLGQTQKNEDGSVLDNDRRTGLANISGATRDGPDFATLHSAFQAAIESTNS